ncbi:dimeric dihydrodiol dehydrogenase [Penicillium chermesinum]|uniref:Dimeric dihydrodiol dehydrogenase n=1 Tax=Penicillium chermesinum TaxID=63820 RepID=A0A9W9PJX7_9EURO|nr:dimeric dihydrodiol dehydrogenase [Penicillium chermesinum]KAJ5248818.1 dimeric dihydrodiol dehydrogenase [Penicillium chermesinum]
MEEREVGEGEFVKRRVTLWNHLGPSIWHRIDVRDTHVVREGGGGGAEVGGWEADPGLCLAGGGSEGGEGEGVLEEFVNRVKGREGSGVWIDGRDSVRQMEIVDQVYKQAGLSPRPGTGFTV